MHEQTLAAALAQCCAQIHDAEIESLKTASLQDRQSVKLERKQIFELSERIQSLPQICRDVLLARYSYKMGAEDIESIYGVDDARGKCLYAEKLLGCALNLKDGEMLSPEDLTEACDAAEKRVTEEILRDIETHQVKAATRKHERRMRDILRRGGKRSKLFLVTRAAAMFALVMLISGTIALSVSAELRAKVLDWVITRFQEYSAIGGHEYVPRNISESEVIIQELDRSNEYDLNLIARYAPKFIPESFALAESYHDGFGALRTYTNSKDEMISIRTSLPEDVVLYNTEDAELESFTMFEHEAFKWVRLGFSFVVFQYDGYNFNVIVEGQDMQTALRIAESITHYDDMVLADRDKPKTADYQTIENMLPDAGPYTVALESVNIYDFHGKQGAMIVYKNIYGEAVNIQIQKDTTKYSEVPENGEIFQWLDPAYITGQNGEFKFLLDGNVENDGLWQMAQSMLPDK